MNTCVTPLYRRPEYFKLWIEYVRKCDGAKDIMFIFCCDFGYDSAHDELIRQFPFPCGQVRMPQTYYKLSKQSYNVLNGLVAGARHSGQLVYYLEEDVFPARDFFRWHAEVHRQQADIFCSIATRNNNTRFRTDGFMQHYYLSDRPDYQALGTCFRKEVIMDLIAPHFVDAYFLDPLKYCKLHFPHSVIGHYYVEQDGLIRRILEGSRRRVAFPHVPRGFHGGLYGYNRGKAIQGTIDEKVEFIRKTAFSKEELMKYVQDPYYYHDSEPCDLDTDFDYLALVETLPLTKDK